MWNSDSERTTGMPMPTSAGLAIGHISWKLRRVRVMPILISPSYFHHCLQINAEQVISIAGSSSCLGEAPGMSSWLNKDISWQHLLHNGSQKIRISGHV